MYLSSVSSRLLLHDFNSWELKKSYGCYDGLLRDITWSDDGKYLLQVNPRGLVEILSTADHDVRSLQHVPLRETWTASFHRDGHRNVAIGTRSGNVLIWDTKNKTITKSFPTPSHQVAVNFLSYNAKNTSLAASMQNGDTIIYGIVSNIPVLTVKLSYSKSISAMKFHHECRSLLGLATDEGHMVVRDITTNKDKAFFENIHASPVSDFSYSPINKDVLLSCGLDKTMHVYDIRLHNVVSTIRTPHTLTCIAMNSENNVALGTKTGPILIYDLRDVTSPSQIIKGHEEEVVKIAFQPIRKKTMCNELSIREDADVLSPLKPRSPTKTRSSDIFMVGESPPRSHNSMQGGDNADSFLVMMGLDKTNNDITQDMKIHFEDRKSDKLELRFKALDAEKHISKASTPLNSKLLEPQPSPICFVNGKIEEGTPVAVPGHSFSNLQSKYGMDQNTQEELKDFIKLTVGDVADDNRNYFLHVMMALTKQKLFLEKQVTAINDQMQLLSENQKVLLESNRRLSLEIEKLKSQKDVE